MRADFVGEKVGNNPSLIASFFDVIESLGVFNCPEDAPRQKKVASAVFNGIERFIDK